MSFAPKKEVGGQSEGNPKGKSKTMHPAKKSGQALGYGKTQEDGKDEVASRSDKDETGMKHSQSIRSAADGNFNERVVKMENDISVLQQQQDSFRQLLSLKDTVENLLKDQKTLQGLIKRTTLIEERLEEFENRFDEYQRKTEQFLVVLDKNIDEESAIRADENKQIKKVCTELERRQKEMDYEVKMDIKNTEIKLKQELVDVCANIDKKTDAHKEFLENHINAIHRAIKSTIIDDEERLDALTRKVEGAHAHFDSQIKRLDETVIPTIDSANKRRKVDYADLKAWLLESIDERLNNKEKKLEDTVKKSYKSTVVKQKSEIENLKREVSLLGASPNRNTKGSNIAPSEPFNDDQYNDNFESGNEDRKSGFEFVNVEKQEIQATEFRPQNSIKETKERMEQIERFTINSGDEIGNKLDQQKISIFDWNDKILKASKKLEKFKKNKKMNNKKEIREICQPLVKEFPEFEFEVLEKIRGIKDEIKQRKAQLENEFADFESNISDTDAVRFKNSREQLSKQIDTSHSYLTKGVENIEAKLQITKTMLAREIESNLNV